MTSRQDEVRIVQVDPDGNVVYQGASEREATVRLFDTSTPSELYGGKVAEDDC